MKSAEGKNAWRALIKEFSDEKMVKDHNFGTLVRKDCRGDYTEENSIFSEYLIVQPILKLWTICIAIYAFPSVQAL